MKVWLLAVAALDKKSAVKPDLMIEIQIWLDDRRHAPIVEQCRRCGIGGPRHRPYPAHVAVAFGRDRCKMRRIERAQIGRYALADERGVDRRREHVGRQEFLVDEMLHSGA